MTKPKNNHPLKARLFIGGLKSLFGDMHDMLEEVEKTGQMSRDMIETLTDVHEAIDLAVAELKKVMAPCCDHSPDAHMCDDSCTESQAPTDRLVVDPFETPPGAPEAFVIDEEEEDDQEPVEEIQGQGKGSWSVCDVCECEGGCEPDEQRGCDVCGCGCSVEENVTPTHSFRELPPSYFSPIEMGLKSIPFDSNGRMRVIRHNTPTVTYTTEENLDSKQVTLEVPLVTIPPVDDPLGEKEEVVDKGEVLPAEKKRPKKKSKTKK